MAESLKQIVVTGLVLMMLVTIYLSVGTVNDDGQADTEEAVLLRRAPLDFGLLGLGLFPPW